MDHLAPIGAQLGRFFATDVKIPARLRSEERRYCNFSHVNLNTKSSPSPGEAQVRDLSLSRVGPEQWFQRMGRNAWYALGIVAVLVLVFVALGGVRSFVVPLIIALILGAILAPVTKWLQNHGMGATGAAASALLGALLLSALVVYIVVVGFLEQIPQIASQLSKGWVTALAWLQTLDLDPQWLDQGRIHLQAVSSQFANGVFGFASTAFSGLLSLLLGSFFAVFFLFFILRDSRKLPSFLARGLRVNQTLVEEVAEVTSSSVRGYFKGTAITALITEPIFLAPLLILNIPLFIPMAVMYFVLSFIPYIGAWITAAFAVLIAFGSGGPSAALIVGSALMISNGMIQSAVASWALGSSLKLHPVSVLLATLVGGAVAGILGMVLGAPLLAAGVKSARVIADFRAQPQPQEVTAGAQSEKTATM